MNKTSIMTNSKSELIKEDAIENVTNNAIKRIDSHYISHELFHLWHLDKGFLFNVKELLIRPAASIRTFINERRDQHMKPIGFLIFSAVIYTIIYNNFKPAATTPPTDSYFYGTTVYAIQTWFQKNFGYDFIVKSFFIACWARLFFRKYGYNIFEIMTLMCFVSAQGMLLVGVILPFTSLLDQSMTNILLLGTTILYPIIVLAQFFNRAKALNYGKSLLVYFLGGITQFLLVIGVGLTIDFVVGLFK